MVYYLGDGDLTFAQLIRLFREGAFPSGTILQKDGEIIWPRKMTEAEKRYYRFMEEFLDELENTED